MSSICMLKVFKYTFLVSVQYFATTKKSKKIIKGVKKKELEEMKIVTEIRGSN